MKLKTPHIDLNQVLFILTMVGTIVFGLGIYQIIVTTDQPAAKPANQKVLNLDTKTYDKIIEEQKSDTTIKHEGNIGRDNPFDPLP